MKDPVRVSKSKHPRYSHRVFYPGEDGKRQSRFFATETEALEFAKDRREEHGDSGRTFGTLTEPERAAVAFWRAFVKSAGDVPVPDLRDVLRDAKRSWEASRVSVKVPAAVETYLTHQEASGASSRHLATLRSRLGRFATDHPECPVATISTGQFQDWLNRLRGTRSDKAGDKLSAATRFNFTRTLRSFFTFAEERGWTLKNPIPAAKRSKTKSVKLALNKAPEILLPGDVSRFLNAVHECAPLLVPFWAVKFFAGIRDAEAARLDWSMIDLAGGEIHLPAAISKTGEQRTVAISENLAAWLRQVAKKSGPIVQKDSTRKRRFKRVLDSLAARGADGEIEEEFHFPSNAARHCFGTFHLFHFRNAGETALQLGHKGNPAMLHEHYKNPTAEKHAAEFWEIMPPGRKPRKAGRKRLTK